MSTTRRASERARLGAAMLGACGVLLGVSAPAAAGSCAKQPKHLTFSRQVGKHVGRLSWQATASASSTAYRVYRNGAVVGQTEGLSLVVRVAPGRRYVFTVQVVSRAGKATSCKANLTRKIEYHPPFPPHGLAVRNVTDAAVTLVWSAARRGDGRIAGYRVFRNGRVYRQVKKRRIRIRLNSPQTYRFAVVTADTRGRLSHRSRTVRVRNGHQRPGRPRSLRAVKVTDTVVGLAWTAGNRTSGRIVGYRVFRNGTPLRQVKGLAGEVSNLAPATGYRFTVAAIDSLGYVSSQTTPVSVTTGMPPPTLGRAHAFLLASTDESFRDLQRHYRQIGTVYPTYFDCPPGSATIRGAEDPLVTRWAQLRGIQVLPRYDCQRPTVLHDVLTNPTARAAVIAGLVSLVRTYGYNGINLDFEAGYATDRDALTSFAATLAAQLHALGRKLSVEVSAKWTNTTIGRSGFYDYAALGKVADNVFVMNWGWHWTTSGPGPSDEIANATKVADYVATMPNKTRFVLAAPLYAQDWPNGGGPSSPSTPVEYGDLLGIIARYGGTPTLDSFSNTWYYTYRDAIGTHDVWFGDATTIANRVRLAKTRGLGVGFWRLGREDQRVWDDPLLAPGAPWP
jgi:spore germination protein YaaH